MTTPLSGVPDITGAVICSLTRMLFMLTVRLESRKRVRHCSAGYQSYG
jgi:hypothetical protein